MSTDNSENEYLDTYSQNVSQLSSISSRSNVKNQDNMINQSEIEYISIVKQVVLVSRNNLDKESEIKKKLRDKFSKFFKVFIVIQFIFLVAFIFINAFARAIPDNILLTYITAVFVETLGIIAIMIKFAFDSKAEVEIINILNSVVKNYQKYNNKDK